MYTRKPYTLDRTVRLFLNIATLVIVVLLVRYLKDVLLPFFVAALIAYIFEPFVQFNRRLLHLRGRIVAIFVTLFEMMTFIAIACYFVVPMIVSEVNSMGKMLSAYASSELNLPYLPAQIHDFVVRNVNLRQVSHMLSTFDWTETIRQTLSTAWDVLAGSVTFLISAASWCIVLLYVIFIMVDYDRLGRLWRNLVPPRYRKNVFKVLNDIKTSMNLYFRGQALIAFLVGVLFAVGFSIIEMPMAIIFGLFIGMLNMVPYLQLVSLVPAVVLCFVASVSGGVPFWPMMGKCIAVYCVVQAIQDLVLTPKIMGKTMGLNPALILLSLSVWGSLLGLLGLIIALPLTTLLLAYYNEYVIDRGHRHEAHILEDVESFPDGDDL